MLARISLSLDKVEQRQAATLTDLEERIDTRARRMRSVLADLGVDLGQRISRRAGWRTVRSGQAAAIGRQRLRTPTLSHQCRPRADRPLHAHAGRRAGPQAGHRRGRYEFAVRHAHGSVSRPARRPYRHRSARRIGEPVRATATGSVTIAGREGGYGNMVEINHGNGLATPLRPHVRKST